MFKRSFLLIVMVVIAATKSVSCIITANEQSSMVLNDKQNHKITQDNLRILQYKNEIFDLTYPHTSNKNSNVIAVCFFDYSCKYCRTIKHTIELLINDDKVNFIFRDTPMLGNSSLIAAKSALAVYFIDKQKYFDFYGSALEHTELLSWDDILRIIQNIGLSKEDFYNSMKTNMVKIEKMIESNRSLARDLGVGGIPFIIIGDSLFTGAVDLNILRKKIDILNLLKK